MWKSDPAVADVNGDGHLDIGGLPRLGTGPRVFLGNGAGAWTESSQGLAYDRSCGGGLEFVDISGDGKLDLVAADHCQGIYVYLGDGTGKWTKVVEQLHPAIEEGKIVSMYSGSEDLTVGDINGDGYLDIVAGGSDESGINAYLGDGSGRNWSISSAGLPSEEWANRITLRDMNGDGALDILAGYSRGPRIWLNDRAGSWKYASESFPSPVVHGLYSSMEVGDINKDGILDIATANWVDGPEVYLGQGDGAYRRQGSEFPELEGGSVGLRMADMDRDGNLDLVVIGRMRQEGGTSRGVFLLYGDGTGKFRFDRTLGLPEVGLGALAGVTVADLNGDGSLDILVGGGLISETVLNPTEPVVAQKLIAWCSHPNK